MSRISTKLRDKIRLTAKDLCGYCQSPQHLIPIPFEIEHILPLPKAAQTRKKTCGSRAAFAIVLNTLKLTRLTRKPNGKPAFSIRENKFGRNILNLAMIKPK